MPQTIDCLVIRYAQNTAAYRFLALRDDGYSFDADTSIESKYAKFFESIFFKKANTSYLFEKESISDLRVWVLNQGEVGR